MGQKITLQNIKNFIQGNARYLGTKIQVTDTHIVEQVTWRASKCPECLTAGHCLGSCKCSVPGRWFVDSSCNAGEKFPDLMTAEDWSSYKQEHNIKFNEKGNLV